MTKGKNVFLSACVALGLAATTAWAAGGTAGSVVDDSVLTAKVKAALIENPATKARQINVETSQGVVQLNGFVETASEKQAAETTAKSIAGVASVDNNLQMRSGERTAGNVVDDSTITAKVKSALLADSRTKGYQVEVKTYKGVVSLGGFVGSDAEKKAAESLAKGVTGVMKVENGISVDTKNRAGAADLGQSNKN